MFPLFSNCPILSVSEFFYRADVQLSLNKKDILDGEDDTTLASLGIVSGDLVFVLGIEDEQPPVRPQEKPAAQHAGKKVYLNLINQYVYPNHLKILNPLSFSKRQPPILVSV